jgi:hypothetical protein
VTCHIFALPPSLPVSNTAFACATISMVTPSLELIFLVSFSDSQLLICDFLIVLVGHARMVCSDSVFSLSQNYTSTECTVLQIVHLDTCFVHY